MRLSRERLTAQAQSTGFRPEILEKVIHLLSLLDQLNTHPQLAGKWALKGGTALNLFILDVPRLSVDIDINYIGRADREGMEADRPKIEQAISAICGREGYGITRSPSDHAGGKYNLRYSGAVTTAGTLQLDVNYMYRVPLFPVAAMDSYPVGSYASRGIPVVDVHEIAAGKLAALLSRHAARDLYDAHRLFGSGMLDSGKLRLAFVVYGAINRLDWRRVSIDTVGFDRRELEDQLIPVLSREALSEITDRGAWAERLVGECKAGLAAVLPLRQAETEFLDRLLDYGEILPDLLTGDADQQEAISRHPGLLWKALNVRDFKSR